MLPRDLLTADDIRAAGFRPEPPSETTDEQSAHVWYPSVRRSERWDIGLGVYVAADRSEADRYWDGVLAELDRADAAPAPVAVGDRALHAEGWLYLRQGGHVLWVAVEGPDPVLARWAAEHLARSVCPRVTPLPPAPEAPAAVPAPPDALSEPLAAPAPPDAPPEAPPNPPVVPEPPPAAGSPVVPDPVSAPGPVVPPESPVVPDPLDAPWPVAEPIPAPEPISVAEPGPVPEPPVVPEPPEPPVLGAAGPGSEPRPAPGDGTPAEAPEPVAVLVPRPTAPGRYRRRHLAHARLAVVGDALVVTDARGREHHLPLDGTANAPEAIGIVLAPRHGPAYLAVLDGHGRPVVRDGEAGAWAPDDVRAFAAATGLRYLEPAVRAAKVDRNRPPVEVEGTPWAFLLLTLGAVTALVVLLVVGAPAVTLLAVPVVAAALGFAVARADQTRAP